MYFFFTEKSWTLALYIDINYDVQKVVTKRWYCSHLQCSGHHDSNKVPQHYNLSHSCIVFFFQAPVCQLAFELVFNVLEHMHLGGELIIEDEIVPEIPQKLNVSTKCQLSYRRA